MKLFKILMYSIATAIAAVILAGTITGCHSLKKATVKTETKSDSSSTVKGQLLRYDAVTGTWLVFRDDSTHTITTDDYNRKTVVEEFDVPNTVHKEDYGLLKKQDSTALQFTGREADSIWSTGHLVKRITIWEKGVLTKAETSTSKGKDSVAVRAGSRLENTTEEKHQGSRVETNVQQTKQVSKFLPGWIVGLLLLLIIIALIYYAGRRLKLF